MPFIIGVKTFINIYCDTSDPMDLYQMNIFTPKTLCLNYYVQPDEYCDPVFYARLYELCDMSNNQNSQKHPHLCNKMTAIK